MRYAGIRLGHDPSALADGTGASDAAEAKVKLKSIAFDLVVLDPPRSGAGAAVIDALAAVRPAQIVYVACDPVAFARDVALLADAGYDLAGLRAFDLFPHTHHVEAVGAFRRG